MARRGPNCGRGGVSYAGNCTVHRHRFTGSGRPWDRGRRCTLPAYLTVTSSASVTVNELLSVTSSLRHDILAPLHAAGG